MVATDMAALNVGPGCHRVDRTRTRAPPPFNGSFVTCSCGTNQNITERPAFVGRTEPTTQGEPLQSQASEFKLGAKLLGFYRVNKPFEALTPTVVIWVQL